MTELVTIPTLAVTLVYTKDFATSVLVAGGCLSGILLTPDLDQEGISSSEWVLVKKTKGVGFLWLMLWYPYALLIPHRAFLSHFPIVGTVGRLLYLSIVPVAILLYLDKAQLVIDIFPYVLRFGVGLAISDFMHWIFDIKV